MNYRDAYIRDSRARARRMIAYFEADGVYYQRKNGIVICLECMKEQTAKTAAEAQERGGNHFPRCKYQIEKQIEAGAMLAW